MSVFDRAVQVFRILRILSTEDLSLSSTDHPFQIGPSGGRNMRFDNNEIQNVDDGVAATMNLNVGGGDVNIGNSASTLSVGGVAVPLLQGGTVSVAGGGSTAVSFAEHYDGRPEVALTVRTSTDYRATAIVDSDGEGMTVYLHGGGASRTVMWRASGTRA